MKVSYRSKNALVYDQLRKAIIAGDYKPGTRLVIDQLAIELGVSQIPIREAMRELEGDGFVTIEPYAGSTVTALNASFIFEIFALLESIEIVCSRTIYCRMTDLELATLTTMIDTMEDSLNDPDLWSQQNKDLHLYICDCAHSVLSKNILQKVMAHWDRLRLHYFKDVFGQRIHFAQQEHRQILAAFRARDLDQLEQAISTHNQNGLHSYLGYLRSAGLIDPAVENCL
ncbi:MAG: GntR family transcriptional regulator [Chloroflexota bacterium]